MERSATLMYEVKAYSNSSVNQTTTRIAAGIRQNDATTTAVRMVTSRRESGLGTKIATTANSATTKLIGNACSLAKPTAPRHRPATALAPSKSLNERLPRAMRATAAKATVVRKTDKCSLE